MVLELSSEVSECKPLPLSPRRKPTLSGMCSGDAFLPQPKMKDSAAPPAHTGPRGSPPPGTGIHSSTFQLNLSRY